MPKKRKATEAGVTTCDDINHYPQYPEVEQLHQENEKIVMQGDEKDIEENIKTLLSNGAKIRKLCERVDVKADLKDHKTYEKFNMVFYLAITDYHLYDFLIDIADNPLLPKVLKDHQLHLSKEELTRKLQFIRDSFATTLKFYKKHNWDFDVKEVETSQKYLE